MEYSVIMVLNVIIILLCMWISPDNITNKRFHG